jgi:hypothetical protein
MAWQIGSGIALIIVVSVTAVGLHELATGQGTFPWQRHSYRRLGRAAIVNRGWGLATALVGTVFGVNLLLGFTGRHAPEWFHLLQTAAQLVFLAMLLWVMASAIHRYAAPDKQRLSMPDAGSLRSGGWHGAGLRRNALLLICFTALVVLISLGFWIWLGRS